MIGTGLIVSSALAAAALALFARERSLRRREAASRPPHPAAAAESFARLAGSLSHEAKNPINALSLTFQFLERLIGRESHKLERAADVQKHLAAGASEVEKLKRTVEAFVELVRPCELALVDVDLAAVAQHAIEVERGRRNGAAAGIEHAVEGGPLRARVDPGQIERALEEVIGNAFDAVAAAPASKEDTPAPERRGRIEVRCERDAAHGTARIFVRDTGAGFCDRALARACEPYFTTKPEHAGLGLARARLIVEAHGGRLDAANRSGADGQAGAEVRIELPGGTPGRG